MFSYLFTFRSQTAAQSGRRILYESGLRAQLRRAPPEISGLGCTWALYVGGEDGVHAAQLRQKIRKRRAVQIAHQRRPQRRNRLIRREMIGGYNAFFHRFRPPTAHCVLIS